MCFENLFEFESEDRMNFILEKFFSYDILSRSGLNLHSSSTHIIGFYLVNQADSDCATMLGKFSCV